MLATFPTLTPNTDALTQWGDFSVTAPSGLVPWPAFYDGTEIVSVTWWSPAIWWIYPWYQLARNIFFSFWSFNNENWFQWMAQYWSNMIYFFLYRYDSSDDFTTVYPLVVDTSLNISWTPSQNINNLTSWSSPFWVQQWHYNNISRDGGDQFKYIRWQWWPDWEVIYNALTDTRSWYTYTRNSWNKVQYANTVDPNWIINFLWTDKLMTMFVNNNSWANFLDPYLEIH